MSPERSLDVLWLILLSAALACSGESRQAPDGAVDSAVEDAGRDAGSGGDRDAGGDAGDAGLDAGADAGDAGADAGDAGLDAGGDDALDAGADAGDAGADAGADGSGRPDHDPASSFLLEVPEGAVLCTVFCEGRGWRDEHEMMGRVDLRPGFYALPRGEGALDLDLVQGVVFGPDLRALQPDGPPGCEVRYYYGAWQYILRQDMLLDSTPYLLELWIWYEPSYWGPEWPAENALEGEFAASFVWASATLGPGSGWCEDHQGFCFCDLSSQAMETGQGSTARGDWVELGMAYAQACMVAGNTSCKDVHHARLSLGGAEREL
ncbi:MAG: hypothetical protein JXR96_22820, partial [Deltaproteobacteria bacterium]|nr:hypothetical protein [Deltaproteobacteria bacterium]